MSKEAVEAIIGKAVVDSKFREMLFADPGQALEGYELTEVEMSALKAVDAETIESFASALDERVSKSDFMGVISSSSQLWAGQSGPFESWYQEHILKYMMM